MCIGNSLNQEEMIEEETDRIWILIREGSGFLPVGMIHTD